MHQFQNELPLLIRIVLAMLAAGIVHLGIIRFDLWPFLKKPLDGGSDFFGNAKTWRGVIVMSLCCGVFLYALEPKTENMAFGALLGLGYSLFELPNSLVKRRLGIRSGEHARGGRFFVQYLIDQSDSVAGVAMVSWLIWHIGISSIAFLFIIGTIVHIIVDAASYRIGIKKWQSR